MAAHYHQHPDENVHRVHINAHRVVHRVEIPTAGWRPLRVVNHPLGVVQDHQAEQDQAAVHGQGEKGQAGGGRRREKGGGQRGQEHHEEAGSQGGAPRQKLLVGGAHGHRGQAAAHAGGVDGGADDRGAAEEAQRGDGGPQHGVVKEQGELLGAEARLVGNGLAEYAGADEQGEVDHHADDAVVGQHAE